MVRLFDRLLHEPRQLGVLARPGSTFSLAERTLIVADNVAEHYWRGTDQEEWDLQEDFPNIAPPFERMFIEAAYPAYSLSKVTGLRPIDMEVGAVAIDARRWEGLLPLGVVAARPTWGLALTPFIRLRGASRIVPPAIVYLLLVDADGRTMEFRNACGQSGFYLCLSVRDDLTDPTLLRTVGDALISQVHVALLALSFMHCKNVELRPTDPPRALAKAHHKRTGMVLHRHHVIEIDPFLSQARATAAAHGVSGLRQSLHICRGHFKQYRQRGLFGKHTGTFWWPQHARGSPEQGTVSASYRVHPPAQQR